MLQSELRQAKNRTRAIAVTDIAISKVSKIHFNGFDDMENEYIKCCHQHLLRKVQGLCAYKKNNAYEYGIIVNLHTWEMIEIEGICGGVYIDSISEARYALENGSIHSLLYMHNHPSTETFSAIDIKTFLMNPAIYIMTAVGNDGCVYMIQKTAETNVMGFFKEYLSRVEMYRNSGNKYEATLAIHDMLHKASEYGLIYKRGGRSR